MIRKRQRLGLVQKPSVVRRGIQRRQRRDIAHKAFRKRFVPETGHEFRLRLGNGKNRGYIFQYLLCRRAHRIDVWSCPLSQRKLAFHDAVGIQKTLELFAFIFIHLFKLLHRVAAGQSLLIQAFKDEPFMQRIGDRQAAVLDIVVEFLQKSFYRRCFANLVRRVDSIKGLNAIHDRRKIGRKNIRQVGRQGAVCEGRHGLLNSGIVEKRKEAVFRTTRDALNTRQRARLVHLLLGHARKIEHFPLVTHTFLTGSIRIRRRAPRPCPVRFVRSQKRAIGQKLPRIQFFRENRTQRCRQDTRDILQK